MKNKKLIIILFSIILLFFLLNNSLYIFLNNKYKINYNKKINNIIYELNNKYPELKKEDIILILNNKNNNDENILKEYGINLENEFFDLNSEKEYKKILIINNLLIILFIFNLIIIFLIYYFKEKNRINKIIKDLEKINNKNYEINIEENEEGNLSILKNELYKTTIMLKEQAENSYNDKINLKSSLEDISHQLKTPLTSINIMLDNILDNPKMDDETKLDFITDIKRETNNINFLIQALLKLSKFDTNTVKFNNEENDLKQIINEAIKNVSVLCDLKNIKIIFNCKNNLNLICDKKWQIESLTNIIKNCVEYSEENNKININVENNKIYYLIKIKDYGKEINKKDLNHIFERFYKGKNSKNDSIGIGLALSKAIIEKNNGKVWVESNENETIFYVQYFK